MVNRLIPQDFYAELEAMLSDEKNVEFVTTRWSLWCLLSAVQLASRHPQAMATAPMREAVQAARQIQAAIATTPGLQRVAAQGWDRTADL